ncbi:hypothetical protein AV521_18510 [Streptomyces sp. IMTB 2501]|uniref:hypothetical protein n=1 Tax=Streptomyces sp. IMTB 2501 TaxID=1776340 RepID=UPI00096C1CD8|nr:hypothetical protein [Streptomyces sp. IMTB 2501]OLZ69502.1 hypothetical protein AV521_18510 [Streptomyces sp. IMTB 2501]
MSDNVLSVIPTDPCWQPGHDAAVNAVHALRAVTPEEDGTRAEWTETMMFVACGSNFERLFCPECDAVLDQMWWRDLFWDCLTCWTGPNRWT